MRLRLAETARASRDVCALVVGLLLVLAVSPANAQVDLWEPRSSEPIAVSAESGTCWVQGSYEVWVLRGNCRIVQSHDVATGREAVVWVDRADPLAATPNKLIAYLEGEVRVEFQERGKRAQLADRSWLGRFASHAPIEVSARQIDGPPEATPPIYQRAMARRSPLPDGAVRRAQYLQGAPGESGGLGLAPGTRRVRAFPRSDVPVQAQWFPDRATQQWIGVLDGGVQFIVDGLAELGSIDVSTDRLVIWTTGAGEPDLSGQRVQGEDVPLEIYMEGNIVFRQGDRVIRAERMYYDVNNRAGMVLDGEMLSPVAKYEGLLRLRARILRQLNQDQFLAQDAFITSSRMGAPGYRLQVGTATFDDHQAPAVDPWTGLPRLDPQTREPLLEHQRLATAQNNFIFLGDLPVFYWPYLATDLEEPSFYIRRVRLKNDNVFGTQVLTHWNVFQLLGVRRRPRDTDWDLSLDYLSDRGFGHGTALAYSVGELFDMPGPASGLIDFWGIHDSGWDNLGSDRRRLDPEADYRFRLLAQHRQVLPEGFQLTAELGWISDRNFLEQYFKREWDELKDRTTGLELKQIRDNMSWSLSADYRLNDFVTQTDWLPRVDHFWLGQRLMGDALTWHEHTSIGYARFRTAAPPTDPFDQVNFNYLPWELSSGGTPLGADALRAVTRHELDWPFQMGPVKIVPYGLGELGYWGQDRFGNDLTRTYWQAGVRASVPFWAVNPAVESGLWNVHGLAHKVVFEAEVAYADANQPLDRLPLYDPLDDDNLEVFRRRFSQYDFGGVIPLRFDERYYALRSGLGGWVTSPSMEIADDLLAVRVGVRQRWQTKRGMPGRQRIVDWITLDANMTLFPDADRDNFGSTAGLTDYDFRWQVGDRLLLLSSGTFDFFGQGQKLVSVGGILNRPPSGSLYLGARVLEGPIHSTVLLASYSYRMSPKWISTLGVSIDVTGDGNIGESFTLTRIGESFLITAGVNADAARNSVGANLAIEPRFLPKGRLGAVGGARVPVAGAYGLE